MGQYHLRQRVGQTLGMRVGRSIHPLTQVVLTSLLALKQSQTEVYATLFLRSRP